MCVCLCGREFSICPLSTSFPCHLLSLSVSLYLFPIVVIKAAFFLKDWREIVRNGAEAFADSYTYRSAAAATEVVLSIVPFCSLETLHKEPG